MNKSDIQETVVISDYEDEDEEIDRRKLTWWKPGQSGNPAGRPKGKTMKEYVRDMLSSLTDEERIEFLREIPRETLWKMAEGNPTEDRNIKIQTPVPLLGGMTQMSLEQQKETQQALGGAVVDAIEDTSA